MTPNDFFEAYRQGERHFSYLDFEDQSGFSNNNFAEVVFEDCALYLDFRNSNLTNARFIRCNIKEIDLRYSNLTGALMVNCLVESALFYGANVHNFTFSENYYYGLTLGQEMFNEQLLYGNAFILKQELAEEAYKSTLIGRMTDVTETAAPIVEISEYVKHLAYEGFVPKQVYEKGLVEKVYRNEPGTFDHVLLPTDNQHIFIVLIIEHKTPRISGYYRLNLADAYGIE